MGSILLWAACLGLLVYAFFISQRAKAAERKADRMTERLYSWGSETRSAVEELQKQFRRLDFEIRRRAGEIQVTGDMRIADILALHPRIKEVLSGMHLGGCSSCASSEQESLAAGAASYGLDAAAILTEIQRFLADPDHYQSSAASSPDLIPIALPRQVSKD